MTTDVAVRTIVVALDGSPGSGRALEWAARHALESGAVLIGTHVLTYSREFANDLSLFAITNWRRDVEGDLAGPWTEAARAMGAAIRTTVAEDETAAAGILAVAEREDAELVVLGAHSRGNLADRLLGATTYTVAHRARTPVVIIPPGWTPTTPA